MLGRGYIHKLGHSSADWDIADLEVMIRGHLIMEERIFYVYERERGGGNHQNERIYISHTNGDIIIERKNSDNV